MINEFQHKGYALLFGFVALVLTFIFWGVLPPFYWLGPAFVFFYLGAQIGRDSASGRWMALAFSLLPLWVVLLVLSWGRPEPYTHLSLILVSLIAGVGGVWLASRSFERAEWVLKHVAWPLAAGLTGMLVATLLMFVVSASGIWPWKEIPPFAMLLPVVMALCVLWTNRLQGRLWWRDALLIWVVPFLFFVVYRPFLMTPEARDMARFETDNWWMTLATLAGILLTLALALVVKRH